MKKFFILLVSFLILFAPFVSLGQTTTYNPSQNVIKKTNVLRVGSAGPEVFLLQAFLAKQGLLNPNSVDGKFGPMTKAAVVRFQKLASLEPADGIVGPGSLFFMQNIMYSGLVLKDASKSDLAYLQNLYKQSKSAGLAKSKDTPKQVLSKLLSVTPLTQTPKPANIVATKNIGTVLAPKTPTLAPKTGTTTQKNILNTDALKTFTSSTGSQVQYSCTFTSQYTQVCVPLSSANNIASNQNTNQNQQNTTSNNLSLPPSSSGQVAYNQYLPNTTPGNPVYLPNLSNPTTSGPAGTPNSGSSTSTGSNTTAPLNWYCTDPSCSTLGATTLPWWQSTNNAYVNPYMADACIPLSGYDIKLNLTAEDIFTVYAYKQDTNGKVTEMIPVCRDLKSTVLGVPSWRSIEKCRNFKLAENQNLAIVVADDGKVAEGWIGRLEIAGNIYFSQDYSWHHLLSQSKLPTNMVEFPTNQVMQEMNTGTWGATRVLGGMGIDPWGIFTDDTVLDEASWIEVSDPGKGKFSVYRLKNCGLATPAASIDLKVENADSVAINPGESVDLTWTTANLTSCTATSMPTNTAWMGSKSPLGGSVSISNINQNTTLNISCNSEAGTVTDSVQVLVKPTVDLKVNNANSASVSADQTVNLSWTSSNATSCSATGGSTGWLSAVSSSSGNWTSDQLGGGQSIQYTISCSGAGGSATDTVTVNVSAATPSVSLTANTNSIISGESVTLNWNPQFVDSCTASSTPLNSNWNGSKSASVGTQAINNLTTSTQFSIECTNASGTQTEDSVYVTVTNGSGQPSVELTSTKILVDLTSSNKSTQILWKVTGISDLTSCVRSGYWSGSTPNPTGQLTKTFSTPGTFTFTLTCGGVSGSVSVDAANTQTVKIISNKSTVPAGQPVKLTWASAALPAGKKCKRTKVSSPVITAGTEANTIFNSTWNDSGFTASQSGSASVYVPLDDTNYTFTITCEKDTSGGVMSASVDVSGVEPSPDGPKINSVAASSQLNSNSLQFIVSWSELVKANPSMTSANQLCVEAYKTSNNELLGNFCAVGNFPQYNDIVQFEGVATGSVPTQTFQATGTVIPNGIDLESWSSSLPAELNLLNFEVLVS